MSKKENTIKRAYDFFPGQGLDIILIVAEKHSLKPPFTGHINRGAFIYAFYLTSDN